MKKCSNWEYDLYMRLDSEQVFNASMRSEYTNEILWCYRLGFMDEDAKECLLSYLDFTEEKISLNREKAHKLRLRQLEYEQSVLLEKKQLHDDIKHVFTGK